MLSEIAPNFESFSIFFGKAHLIMDLDWKTWTSV